MSKLLVYLLLRSDYKKTKYSKPQVASNDVYYRRVGLPYRNIEHVSSTMCNMHNINNMVALF